ncbi:MAG: hypothetical protein ACF8NJ_07230 [Phycisphaerales bacterium JB038]
MGVIVAIAVCGASLAGGPAWGQQFTVEDRVLASVDPSGGVNEVPIWEATIAAGPTHVVTAFNMTPMHAQDLGYAVYDRTSGEWSEGIVPPGDGIVHREIDPVLVYDSVAGHFLLIQLNDTLKRVEARTYQASTDTWADWTPVYTSPVGLDKPWVTPGEVRPGTPDQREFYVILQESVGKAYKLSYARSVDGGATWYGDEVKVDDEIVYGRFTFTACHEARNAYFSFVGTNDEEETGIMFLEGVDDDTVPGQPALEFRQLQHCGIGQPGGFDGLGGGDDIGVPMCTPIFIPLHRSGLQDYLPGTLWQVINGAQIAVDPTDPDRLYVVYADTESDTSSDVNIYFQVLTDRNIPGHPEAWQLGPRIQINDDGPPPFQGWEFDQMLPSIAVDSQGVIYITYYDERDYGDLVTQIDQADGDELSKWDMRITYSLDGGQYWVASQEIVEPLDPGDTDSDPAYDEELLLDDPNDPNKPGEYTGLAVFEGLIGEQAVREVWSAFTGISDDDPSMVHKSVIWSNRSYWTEE